MPGIDPTVVHAWLSGRSIARGVPQPVADHGGFRVDSNTEVEVRRWVFPQLRPGLAALARTIREPRHFLKLCGESDDLRSALPDGWQVHAPSYLMQSGGIRFERTLPAGYVVERERTGMVLHVRIRSDDGEIAAGGYAGEVPSAFVYDRIVTAPGHRRRGLAAVVMATLQAGRQNTASPELLVATEEGRALYSALGWRTISPYATASIPAA